MQKGDVVLVELTGREAESRKVFETTSEEVAKKEGAFSKQSVYKPAVLVIGRERLIKGLEEALLEMKEGEERKLLLLPEKAFGQRKPELVGIVPLKEFSQRKVNPFPGLIVDVNGNAGRVQSVSGGRVRVDFNNDLAGKAVEYEVKIVKRLETVQEKTKALLEKLLNVQEPEFKLEGEVLKAGLPKEIAGSKHSAVIRQVLEKEITESIQEIKKVEFQEKEKEEGKRPEKQE